MSMSIKKSKTPATTRVISPTAFTSINEIHARGTSNIIYSSVYVIISMRAFDMEKDNQSTEMY